MYTKIFLILYLLMGSISFIPTNSMEFSGLSTLKGLLAEIPIPSLTTADKLDNIPLAYEDFIIRNFNQLRKNLVVMNANQYWIAEAEWQVVNSCSIPKAPKYKFPELYDHPLKNEMYHTLNTFSAYMQGRSLDWGFRFLSYCYSSYIEGLILSLLAIQDYPSTPNRSQENFYNNLGHEQNREIKNTVNNQNNCLMPQDIIPSSIQFLAVLKLYIRQIGLKINTSIRKKMNAKLLSRTFAIEESRFQNGSPILSSLITCDTLTKLNYRHTQAYRNFYEQAHHITNELILKTIKIFSFYTFRE